MLVGQPQLGFSITSPFKAVAKGIYTAHVVGTKALIHVAKDPRAQRAAVAAAQAYAPDRYAQATQYAQQAQSFLRPPGPQAPIPMPAMIPPDAEAGDDGGGMPQVAPGGRVQRGNMLTFALIGGAVLVVFLMMKK